jgi:phage shock protein PspC (stress-responsive transcriptional regulator)
MKKISVPPATQTSIMEKIREFMELSAFGVCSKIGEKLGIASSRIRMWFIYISFLTFGSPVIIYMILAFWINIKNYIMAGKRNPLRNW